MLDPTRYTVDGLTPSQVVQPASPDALAEALAEAAAEGQAVVPWGGGTQMGFGSPPRKADVVLSTARLDRVLEHSPEDLTATVEAGTTLAAFQEHLAPFGQQVAIDVPLLQRATVGGILATAGSGPRRLGYGNRRDQVIGIRVAHPDGKLTKSGGKVVKNVTGYDMAKLYIGSLGTLGVIVEATFKLAPIPPVMKTVIIQGEDVEQALAVSQQMRAAGTQLLALDLLSPGVTQQIEGVAGVDGLRGAWLLAVEFGGSAASVERQVQDTVAIAKPAGRSVVVLEAEAGQRFWSAVRDFGREGDNSSLILKAAALPSQLPDLYRTVFDSVERTGVSSPSLVARAGNGMLYVFWPAADVERAGPTAWASVVEVLRRASVRAGGSTVVEDCPPQLKAHMDVWGPAMGAIAIMRRLKEQFDPQGVLNPGRYFGGM